ncbi:hypothetical protein CF54_04080 [Streptomyces sp. Tu 6176]|uniref:hypothetical protein n=1 Tax=Streptomyces sp. Tu 6176 TaxID=1470557 RepID=UPI000451B5A8|nr:hypothetical protein [Streptomyces sp. Tu 6176]EYT83988.1 hypothetical protein CF54_04080 [Streptomyces sp. Tu 6176]
MRTRTATATAVLALAALALTGCSSSHDKADDKPSSSPTAARSSAETSSGIPPKPTGEKRQQLLDALKQAAPDVVKYEDKAIDAARNQCAAINGGAQRLDYFASQRFSYKDVKTTEAQGKAINGALKATGFCKS